MKDGATGHLENRPILSLPKPMDQIFGNPGYRAEAPKGFPDGDKASAHHRLPDDLILKSYDTYGFLMGGCMLITTRLVLSQAWCAAGHGISKSYLQCSAFIGPVRSGLLFPVWEACNQQQDNLSPAHFDTCQSVVQTALDAQHFVTIIS